VATALWSHVACAAAHWALAVALLGRARGTALRRDLGLLCLAFALWASAVVARLRFGAPAWPEEWLEAARALAVPAFLVASILRAGGWAGPGRVLAGATLALALAWGVALAAGLAWPARACALLAPALGLACLENLLRNLDEDGRWAAKFAAIGIGLVLAQDLALQALSELQGRVHDGLWAARGAVDALAAPLLALSALRAPEWRPALSLSHGVAFHAAAAAAAGIAMLAVAGAGYAMRATGSDLGAVAEVVGIAAAAIAALAAGSSGVARAWLREVVARHLFAQRYDYRAEWLRFMATMSEAGEGRSLRERALRAIAGIVDSPGGTLWFAARGDGRPCAASTLNADPRAGPAPDARPAALEVLAAGPPLGGAQASRAVAARDPALAQALAGCWLVLPLAHRAHAGVVALRAPRAPRAPDREDYDLLGTASRQAASYLAEEEASNALAEARQLEALSRRFAFVAHDVKNMAGQIQLLLRNAELHDANPEFRRDMLATLRGVVARMAGLLHRLSGGARAAVAAPPLVELGALLGECGEGWPPGTLRVEAGAAPVRLQVDPDLLASALRQVVQNAVEAPDRRGPVRVTLGARGGAPAIEVADDGAGMDRAFLRDELFRPFRTTREGGYGLGAFQAREILRELGGALEVESAPGAGTVVRLVLPAAPP
jgi:putative PEP-CTERM system histidine kinase